MVHSVSTQFFMRQSRKANHRVPKEGSKVVPGIQSASLIGFLEVVISKPLGTLTQVFADDVEIYTYTKLIRNEIELLCSHFPLKNSNCMVPCTILLRYSTYATLSNLSSIVSLVENVHQFYFLSLGIETISSENQRTSIGDTQ